MDDIHLTICLNNHRKCPCIDSGDGYWSCWLWHNGNSGHDNNLARALSVLLSYILQKSELRWRVDQSSLQWNAGQYWNGLREKSKSWNISFGRKISEERDGQEETSRGIKCVIFHRRSRIRSCMSSRSLRGKWLSAVIRLQQLRWCTRRF